MVAEEDSAATVEPTAIAMVSQDIAELSGPFLGTMLRDGELQTINLAFAHRLARPALEELKMPFKDVERQVVHFSADRFRKTSIHLNNEGFHRRIVADSLSRDARDSDAYDLIESDDELNTIWTDAFDIVFDHCK